MSVSVLLLVPLSLALNPAVTPAAHPKPTLTAKPAIAQTRRVSAPPVLAAAGSSASQAPPGGAPLTALLVGLWYAASVVCNQSSKRLLAGAPGAQPTKQ